MRVSTSHGSKPSRTLHVPRLMLRSLSNHFSAARAVGGALAVAGVGLWQGSSSNVAEADASKHNKFQHPLVDRYASKEMSFIWSPQNKFSTWRKMWIALAQVRGEPH